MSIYATYWSIRLPLDVPCPPAEAEMVIFEDDDHAGYPARERWIEVYCQAVPAHIGHPSNYPNGDPYKDFLPPVAEYDPNDWTKSWTPRAVFILDEDHDEKEGQRYVDPLLALTGAEYEASTFDELLGRIEKALEARFCLTRASELDVTIG